MSAPQMVVRRMARLGLTSSACLAPAFPLSLTTSRRNVSTTKRRSDEKRTSSTVSSEHQHPDVSMLTCKESYNHGGWSQYLSATDIVDTLDLTHEDGPVGEGVLMPEPVYTRSHGAVWRYPLGNGKELWRLGFSEEKAQTLGDVVSIRPGVVPDESGSWPSPPRLAPGTPLATVQWEGLSLSDSDELYHAVWSNVEGEVDLSLPVGCLFRRLNPSILEAASRPVADLNWVVEVEVDVERSSGEGGGKDSDGLGGGKEGGALMNQGAYAEYLRHLERLQDIEQQEKDT